MPPTFPDSCGDLRASPSNAAQFRLFRLPVIARPRRATPHITSSRASDRRHHLRQPFRLRPRFQPLLSQLLRAVSGYIAGGAPPAQARPEPQQPTDEELWAAAEDWVVKQVVATFRHRAIVSRLRPVLAGVKPIDPGDAMLEVIIPSGGPCECGVRYTPGASSGSSAARAPSGCKACRLETVPKTPSVTSVEALKNVVRERIAHFEAMEAASRADMFARQWNQHRIYAPRRRWRPNVHRVAGTAG